MPIRYGDFGRLHRYEKSGVTSGLTRVRSFAQDDAHVFCTPEQVEVEVLAAVEMIREIYDTFGFDDQLELSTRPEKRLGSDELWDRAEETLEAALERTGLDYDINEGDGWAPFSSTSRCPSASISSTSAPMVPSISR